MEPLISPALKGELEAFEKRTGIPAHVLVATATTAALNHFASHGYIELPIYLAVVPAPPSKITRIWEHLIPPDPRIPDGPA